MTTSPHTRASVAARIEATLLAPQATVMDVRDLCAAALAHGVRGVCVAPVHVPVAVAEVAGSGLEVVTVAGFPFGYDATAAKLAAVQAAAASGAHEVDVVMAYGRLLDGEEHEVAGELATLVSAAHTAGLAVKVILESGHLTPELAERGCALAVAAGAEWVKTSTGFGPRGATVDDVRRLREAAGQRARVKAAGGIRTWDDAVALLEAGADALGTSAFVAVLEGAPRGGREAP
ncbi:MAG: deoxyribose-phosphate aldolase [Actinomycetota bacterium]|nr:deoxyribose-phosphate aldolase [Actinomycetota bacterium]